VVQYETDKFLITICQDDSGQYHYDGQIKGAPVDSDNHISLPATQTADGFAASNNGYVYDIEGTQLILTQNGNYTETMQLNRIGP
jgi:hypothetical protein